MHQKTLAVGILFSWLSAVVVDAAETDNLEMKRVRYNNPGLIVDLGVGLWAQPMPMDYDGDGDYDLVVVCSDKPYNGTYFFENPGQDTTAGSESTMPVFKAAVRIDRGLKNVQISYVDGTPRAIVRGIAYDNFPAEHFSRPRRLPLDRNIHGPKVRANHWKFVDYDGDGTQDLIIGIGDWEEYGWDDAYNDQGEWTRGPLHGYVYLAHNTGTDDEPAYAAPVQLSAGGLVIDVFGMPSPNMADFDGDGDLDLLCGEFVDNFTYFENEGTRAEPRFKKGRYLMDGPAPLTVDLCMFVPVAIDWDRDGDIDLVVGQEDGRVMFIEHTGRVEGGMPQFKPPQFFKQEADALKYGALATPVSFDWDGDGDEDLVCGNTAGRIGFIENLDGGCPPKWAAPVDLEAGGEVIRIQAGGNGSIQGPCEAKWGYTVLGIADWDHDGLPDLVVNSIWGKVIWYRNTGTRTEPKLQAAEPIEVEWPGKPPKPEWFWWNPEGKSLATQWRTSPVVVDWNGDGLCDLVMLDHEGYLAYFERSKEGSELVLLPPKRNLMDAASGEPLHLSAGRAGRSGRRKLCVADWDQDGRLDLLINGRNVDFLRAEGGRNGVFLFASSAPVASRQLAGHSTCPTVVDWDQNGIPDLLAGAEDGFFYYLKNPKAKEGR